MTQISNSPQNASEKANKKPPTDFPLNRGPFSFEEATENTIGRSQLDAQTPAALSGAGEYIGEKLKEVNWGAVKTAAKQFLWTCFNNLR